MSLEKLTLYNNACSYDNYVEISLCIFSSEIILATILETFLKMKKITSYLTSFCIVFLFFSSISMTAQDFGCGAAEINKDLASKDFQFVDDVNSLAKDGSTWNTSDGYKVDGTCDHDCNVAPFDNVPPSAGCANGTYQVPIKIWIMTDDDGSNEAVTLTQSTNQISYFNAYQACNNIPIELVQVAGSPEYINSTDFNDFRNPAVSGDSSDDADVASAGFAQTNAVNIYIPSTLNGGGCNGYAYFPGGPDRILMASNCYTTVTDVCADTEFATIFIHEFGHYLGLLHTHGDYVPGSGGSGFLGTVSEELVDGSNGCTTGDFVQDTPADTGISHATSANDPTDNPVGGCAVRSGCTVTFSCTDANTPAQVYVPQLDNIMSYNSLSGCRQEYSDCQKAKMVDALVCSRNYLCGKTSTDFFASSDVSLREKSICVGDAVPDFVALDACKSWYSYSGGTRGALLYTGNNFNPQTHAGISTATAAIHDYWINEANEFNSECGQTIKLTVINATEDATPAMINLTGNVTTTLSAPDPNITASQIIGWWVRSEAPVSNSTFADQTALDAALTTATNGGTVMDNPDNIFGSTTGSPATDFELTMNCNDLNPAFFYYATPFISNSVAAIPDVTCNDVYNGGGVTFNNNQGGSGMIISPGSVSCAPASPPNLPVFSVDVNVTAYGGNTATHNIWLTDFGVTQLYAAISGSGTGIYTFNQSDFPTDFDPNVSGCRIYSYDSTSGATNAGITSNAVLNITYPGIPAVSFPDVDYTPCVFGAPIVINCSAALPVELISFKGEQKGEQIDLFWSTANEQNNDFFSLEKADENGVFQEIAIAKGAGTTDENQFYNETDFRPYVGQNLYRLKQTDFDGKTTTSAVVAINFKADETVDFFPNPVRGGAFTLQYLTEKNAGQAQLDVFALSGQILHTQTLAVERGSNFYDVNVNELPKGVYLARVINGNSVYTFKLTNVQ
ncbi:MAG: hypothetical protein ACI85O_003015 [Saprospiraceae bacterium]|jgi:hypothetical protein